MFVNIDGLKELSLLNLIYSEIILNYHNLEEVGVLRLGKKKFRVLDFIFPHHQ